LIGTNTLAYFGLSSVGKREKSLIMLIHGGHGVGGEAGVADEGRAGRAGLAVLSVVALWRRVHHGIRLEENLKKQMKYFYRFITLGYFN
jgi:hypothetical protein